MPPTCDNSQGKIEHLVTQHTATKQSCLQHRHALS